MKIILERTNDKFLLEAQGASGNKVLLDNQSMEEVKGVSPMELMLMSVGGCNAMDILYVLKKQRQTVESYKVEVEATRKEVRKANPFESIHVTVFLERPIDPAKALRAASMSFNDYCSASLTLEGCVKITYSIVLNGEKILLSVREKRSDCKH